MSTAGIVAAAAERADRERLSRRSRARVGETGAGPGTVGDPVAGAPVPPAAESPAGSHHPGDPPVDGPGEQPRTDPTDDPLAGLRSWVSRRLTGDYHVDEFGLDAHLTEGVLLPVLRLLYDGWFRVDVRGGEHVPDAGAALLVSNHSGTLPWDGLMTQVAVHEVTPSHRLLRPLAADLVLRMPVVSAMARRMGATLATTPDVERLLGAGELVGVWPDGFKGLGKPYRDRYRLQRFGRGGFVSAAIRARVPIVPVAVVGAEEAHPMISDVEPLARLLGVPYWPVTPTWPWLGPLGLVPLPSKWIIEFGVPVPTDQRPAADADDPLVALEVTDHVRDAIQRSLYTLLVQRGPAFG